MGLFGISKKHYWSAFAIEIGGEYVPGGWFKDEYIRYQYLNWEIFIDTFTVEDDDGDRDTYTRFRAYLLNPKSFRFSIYRKNFLTGIGKFFGMQDVEIGDPDFDHHFVIKGNDPTTLVALFADQGLKDAVAEPRYLNLRISENKGFFRKRSIPEHVDTLMIRQIGEVKEKEDLRMFVELLTKTLDRLAEIGAIENRHPGVSIYSKR